MATEAAKNRSFVTLSKSYLNQAGQDEKLTELLRPYCRSFFSKKGSLRTIIVVGQNVAVNRLVCANFVWQLYHNTNRELWESVPVIDPVLIGNELKNLNRRSDQELTHKEIIIIEEVLFRPFFMTKPDNWLLDQIYQGYLLLSYLIDYRRRDGKINLISTVNQDLSIKQKNMKTALSFAQFFVQLNEGDEEVKYEIWPIQLKSM